MRSRVVRVCLSRAEKRKHQVSFTHARKGKKASNFLSDRTAVIMPRARNKLEQTDAITI